MKKTLLGTTALVSAGLVAGPALASDPLTVTVSGSVVTGFYFVDMDTVGGVDADDTKVAVVARNVDIVASGTLDNGLVAGAALKVQLGDDEGNALNTGDDATFSEVYTFLEGGFGRVELGATDGAAFKMHYTSPWFVPGNGVDSPNIYNMNNGGVTFSSRTSTFSLLAEDDNKISYFTPRLAGFQLGASFTPDVGANDPVANGFGLSATNSAVEDVFEVALNYAGEFGGVSIGADVFYVTGEAPGAGATGDPTEQGVGASLGWGGFTLGGAYTQVEDIAARTQATVLTGNESDTWTVGLAYGTGPWTVGAAYFESETENTAGVNVGENSFLQVGGGYSLGAGVDVGLDVQFIEDQRGAAATEVESTSAGVVLAISF
ncbi:MAG: porin [Rhodobiaceae bacterium]|nr:Gram-negative porin [Rhodobiaceae bacterium]MCR9242449.1 porin [Rhodobiaceae bacterium]